MEECELCDETINDEQPGVCLSCHNELAQELLKLRKDAEEAVEAVFDARKRLEILGWCQELKNGGFQACYGRFDIYDAQKLHQLLLDAEMQWREKYGKEGE